MCFDHCLLLDLGEIAQQLDSTEQALLVRTAGSYESGYRYTIIKKSYYTLQEGTLIQFDNFHIRKNIVS